MIKKFFNFEVEEDSMRSKIFEVREKVKFCKVHAEVRLEDVSHPDECSGRKLIPQPCLFFLDI